MSGGALARYDRACRDLAAAATLDVAKDLRDRAEALRVYARQASNRQLEIDASEIRFRAERRIGELMAAARDAGTLAVGGRPRKRETKHEIGHETGSRADPVSPTLEEAGIGKHLADRARRYAAIDPAAFDALLAERRARVDRGAAKITLDLVADDKGVRRAEREVALATKVRTLPDKRYGVILDDPEWRFEVWSRETGLDRAADNHYPTSPLAALVARSEVVAATVAAADCAWFRWVTVPFLALGLRALEVGGFVYKTSWAWAKDHVGTGYWNRNRHEILLLAVRGDVPCPAPGTQWESLLQAPATAHSAKPERFLEMIEAYFPNVPKIELNRRGAARPGWDAWGNEVTEAA